MDSIEVATAQKVSKWKHLSHIADQVKQDNQNLHFELPIAAYCLKAEAEDPIEVIPCRNDGPYAMKTVYVWCIAGPITCSNQVNEKITCNRISVKEAGTSKFRSLF